MQTKLRISDNATPFGPRNAAWFFAAILLAAYFPILLGGQSLCYRDFGVMAIPTASYHRAALLNGELPLWNPYSNCGVPFLAQWGTMVLYPLSLIYVFLPMPWSLNFFCILHLWIGAMGLYFLARRWIVADWPALVAGAAFLCNGVTQSSLSWPNYTAALGLMPWVVLTVEGAWQSDRAAAIPRTLLAALITALQLLTGVPELSIFTWIVLGALWVHRLTRQRDQIRPLLARQTIIVIVAAGLCAAQLLPFFQLLHYSQRAPGFATEKWALPIWGWANFLAPRFHTFTTPEGTIFQYGQEFLSSTYLGGGILLLAGFGFARKNSRTVILGALALLAATLALGSSGLVYPGLVKVCPLLGIARYPVKFLFLLTFAVPLLAGFGARALGENWSIRRSRFLLGFLFLCGALALLTWINYAHPLPYDRIKELAFNSLQRGLLLLLFVATLAAGYSIAEPRRSIQLKYAALTILCLDGFMHLRQQNPTMAANFFQPDLWSQLQNFPKPEHGNGRVFITPPAEARFLQSSLPNLAPDLTGKRLAVWSHLNLLDHVPKVNGSATLQMRDEALIQNSLYSATNGARTSWLDFLNVTLQSSSNSPVEWQARAKAMPFITGGQKPIQEKQPNLGAPIPFAREVWLNPWEAEYEKFSPTPVNFSNIEIRTAELSFDAHTERPTVVVLPATWHPAWKADLTQPGKATVGVSVSKANLAFQAVRIPAGDSHVRMYYHDTLFRLGVGISLGTLLASVLIAWLKLKRPSP